MLAASVAESLGCFVGSKCSRKLRLLCWEQGSRKLWLLCWQQVQQKASVGLLVASAAESFSEFAGSRAVENFGCFVGSKCNRKP